MGEGASAGRLEDAWHRGFSGVLGLLPDHSGQFRLASAYLRRRPQPPGRIRTQRMRNGTRMALDLGDRTQALAYLTRRYDPELVAYLLARLPASGTFVDVGAHVGLVSFAVARARPGATVVAFEPSPANAAAWRANRAFNGAAGAELVARAAADATGVRAFSENADSAAGRLSAAGGTMVHVTTLDAELAARDIDHVDVLKIDTEGAERAVLDGAAGLLGRGAVATIVCELNTEHLQRGGLSADDLTAWIVDQGFRRVALPAPRNRLWRGRPAPPVVDAAFERAGP